MKNFKTFDCNENNGVLNVVFDNPPVNTQDIQNLDDLNLLAENLEKNKEIKVVVFSSNNPEIFIAHADTNFLKDMSTTPVKKEDVELLYLQKTLQRISELPQATIAKIEGYTRGGGNEFALACDMRFATKGKAIFMQMEVGMGILPCGGGASRMARQMGLGRALEIILSARDFSANEAEMYGLINRALEPCEIDGYVENLALRIAKFPSESITACKRTIYKSIDLPIKEALKEEAYQLYQATSTTPAIKSFKIADEKKMQNDMKNQRNWENLVMEVQEIN